MLCMRSARHGYLLGKQRANRTRTTSPAIVRHFASSWTPMTPEEEEAEKERVSKLSAYQKEMELRDLDRQIAKLSMLRGINSGELYTMRGKYKALARDYGFPFMGWYWTCWTGTFLLSYGAIELGLIDTMAFLQKIDGLTGYHISSHVDPTLGAIGLAVALNEVIEPIRLPFVIMTTKPVVHWLGLGPKY